MTAIPTFFLPADAGAVDAAGAANTQAAAARPAGEATVAQAAVPAFADSGRIASLDGIRGLGALLVFLYHCTILDPRNLPEKVFVHLSFLNGLAPKLFFVLSGFLITGVLLRARDKPHYFRNFYIRRALRILPLYYAVVVLSLIVLPWLFPNNPKVMGFARIEGDAWMYWLLVQNFGIALAGDFRHGILDVTWSLAIEEQFYFVWPLLVYVLRKRWLAATCVGVIAFGFAYRCLLVFGLEAHPVAAYTVTFGRMGSLAVGALLSLTWREPGLIQRLRTPAYWLVGLMVPFIWVATAMERWAGVDYMGETGFKGGPYTRTLGDLLTLPSLGGLIVLCICAGPGTAFHRFMTSKVLRTLAMYSYGIYLFHLPVRAFIRDVVFGPGYGASKPLIVWPSVMGSQLPSQIVFYALSMAVVLPLSYLSYHLFEKQFLRLKGPLTEARAAGGGHAATPG